MLYNAYNYRGGREGDSGIKVGYLWEARLPGIYTTSSVDAGTAGGVGNIPCASCCFGEAHLIITSANYMRTVQVMGYNGAKMLVEEN
jgi:hypothetical protein